MKNILWLLAVQLILLFASCGDSAISKPVEAPQLPSVYHVTEGVLSVSDSKAVDSRLLVMIGAFKTASDNESDDDD